jgi:hypothetical protein
VGGPAGFPANDTTEIYQQTVKNIIFTRRKDK